MKLPLSNYDNHSRCLHNRHILITGAGSDPGRQVAIHCARHGARVLLLDQTQTDLNPVDDQIRAADLLEPILIEFAPNSPTEDFTRIAALIESAVNSLDGLAHCANVAAPLTPMSHNSLPNWTKIYQLSVVAPLLLTQQLLPCLKRAKTASVVFTGIDTGRRPRAFWGPIGASYAALENAVQTWADELEASGIRFNTLDPGKVNTALRKSYYPAESARQLRTVDDPLLMAHYMYLLSDNSIGVSGEQFTVPPPDEK